MKINYCLPIINKNKNEILQIIADYKNVYHYFEVWLDYVENVDEKFIKKLMTLVPKKLIILFRRKNLELTRMNLAKRQAIILLISNAHTYLDLDLSQQEEINFIKTNNINCKLIISYHNYRETPDDEILQEIIKEMTEVKPLIYKLATYCKSEADALHLLQLQSILKKRGKKHIILGMGKFGTITRVYGTLWGNEMIFAPIDKNEESAPGQMTKKELKKIFETLNT